MRMVLMIVLVGASAGMHEAALGQMRPPAGGATPSGAIFDRLHNQTTRPVPQAPPPSVRAPDMMWVPDRFVQVPGTSAPVLVPGHWERRLGTHEVYTPPLSGQSPNGDIVQFPAGTHPPVNERQAP
jgi:hypothetical protein